MNENEQAFANGYSTGFVAGKRAEVMSMAEKLAIECIRKPSVINIVVDDGACIPTRAHKNDAGLDLYAMKGGWIPPKCHKVFATGIHAEIPEGWVGMLTSKSGLMLKGITSRGTIDCGFTGDIKAVLYNHSWLPRKIKKGQKITQLVLMPIATPTPRFVKSLEKTDRSDGGFGSTGL